MALPTKQYGLILPQKKGGSKTNILPKPSVFGDDSDDETTVGETLQKEAIKKKMMKQTRLEMQKALEQDSTVYDYDAVYDDMQKQRLESKKKVLEGADKRPKYIHQLMKAVEDRKKEQERRDERKIQKEREAEGEKFADKDAYVTSAYKKKLEEQKEEAEREKRQAEIEAALDVRKQKDLSGFYRHLLNQTVGEEEIPDRSANKNQPSDSSKEAERTSPASSPPSNENIASSGCDSEEDHQPKTGFNKPGGGSAHSNRQYRQRSPSSESGEEKGTERDRHKKSHKDRVRDRDRHHGRERDDRHGDRSDRDRKKERDRDRSRDEDRSRGRRDLQREERHGKQERSPRERHGKRERSPERQQEKKSEKEKRNSDEDRRKDKDQHEETDRKEPEKEKAAVKEGKDADDERSVRQDSKEKEDKQKKEGEEKVDAEEKANKFAKRSTEQTVTSARDRYMARQMARSANKSYIEKEED
ncbi:nuclear speckle splicing regulatory protein 1 [Cyprinodon tularosa]|uniref:nuclear speckle splicing regulatory protein 1 n=1 Tax=Cyprinodon tularosa TaxID=77115 RepID=UPI0018E275C6|nr:nuclear speckle splicing regulatory protein 1 [Cyprinodon tularosa]